jgi:hypothetical protein
VSRSTNLVGGGVADANDQSIEGGGEDVFRFDAATGQTALLSVTPAGTAAGGRASVDPDADPELGPAMSDDGRLVVFASLADDLAPGDANGRSELFVRDAQANTTRRLFDGLALDAGGRGTSASVAGSGNAIAFVGDGAGIVPAAGDVLAQQVFVDSARADGGGGGGGVDAPGDGETFGTLVPSIFTALPATALAGGKLRGAFATVTVTNVAPEDYNGPVTVTLFASTNGTLEPDADPQVVTLTRKLKIASADATSLKVKIPSFPNVPEGDYVVLAQVSSPTAGTGVSTNDESVRLAPPFADLSGRFAAVPATLVKGKRARLTLDVTNAGNVDARGTVPVTIALAADASGANPTTVATVKRQAQRQGQRQPAPLKLNFTLPADAPSGTFFVVARSAPLDPADVNGRTTSSGATRRSRSRDALPRKGALGQLRGAQSEFATGAQAGCRSRAKPR